MTEKTLFIVLDQDMIKTLEYATEAWDALLKSSEVDNKLAKAILTQALVLIGQKVHEAYEKSQKAEGAMDVIISNGYFFSVDEDGVPDHEYIGLVDDTGAPPPDALKKRPSWDRLGDFYRQVQQAKEKAEQE